MKILKLLLKPLFGLDDFLLWITRRITGFVQRTFGYTNFDLAWFVLVLFVLLMCWICGLAGRSQNGFLHSLCVAGITLFMFHNFRQGINETEKENHNPRFLNKNRTNVFFKFGRFYHAFVLILFQGKAVQKFSGFPISPEFFECCMIDAFLMCLIGIMYLLSVEPEPPSESRVRRLVRGVKSWFRSAVAHAQ